MSNTAQPGPGPSTSYPIPNTAGVRRWQRDRSRQQDHVLDQDWRRNRDWNSQAQIEADFQSKNTAQPQPPNPGRQQRNRRRAAAWKKSTAAPPQTAPPVVPQKVETQQYRSTVDSGNRDEPLYDLVSGSRPVRKIYSHNLDFAGFPLLCEVLYRELKQINPRLKREMPFCAFLHSMTTCLNAWLFKTVTEVNSEDRFSDERDALSLIPAEMLVPQPVAEYLGMINTIVTPSGDTVRVNIPDAALPQHHAGDIPPGSFGIVNAQNHNAYECYVSPLVTRNFVIASREAVAAYAPLPPIAIPENSTPTRNLLGYYPVETLTPEGRAVLDMYNFPDTDDMAGRLQVVPAMMQEVSSVLSRCTREFKIVRFHDIQRKPVQTGLIFAKTLIAAGNGNVADVARTVSNVHGPYAFGNATATQGVLFTLKRERVAAVRGLCYVLANNGTPPGWGGTINSNYQMTGVFAPVTGVDGPQYRADLHQAFPPDGLKENFLSDWMKAFRITKA